MKPDNRSKTGPLLKENPDVNDKQLSGDEIPVAIIRVNEHDIIVSANSIAEKLLSARKGKLINSVFLQYINIDDAMTYKIARQNAIVSSTNQVCEIRLFTKNNDQIFCRIDISGQGSLLVLTDRTYKRKVEDTQAFLLGNEWVARGEDFFNALARYLSRVLNAEYICIDRLRNNLEAETVAIYYDGKFEDNIRYSLLDTPCGKVLGSNVCCYPQSVRFLFPNDTFLQEMGAEGYAGITLHNAHGFPIGLIAVISRKPVADIRTSEMILKQVSIRAAAELEHRMAEKKFNALHKSNQVMLTSTSEEEMMKKVCDIITNDCGYSMMWIGTVNNDDRKSITPVVSAGFEMGYIEKLNLTWADTPLGQGPTGISIRSGKPSVCRYIQTDPNFTPWREEAIKRGYASSIALPLYNGTKVFGTVAIYSPQADAFEEEDINILVQMANDLSQGITAIRLRTELQKAIFELNQANDLLEVTVEERTAALLHTNERLEKEISARKNNEKLLRKAEEKYRIVADYTHDCESWLGTNGSFIYISPSFKTVTGYEVEEFMKDSSLYYKIAHPEDRKLVEDHFNNILFPNDHVCKFEYRIITKAGEIRWMAHTCKPVYNSEGDWIGQRGSNRDITEQKNRELTLIEKLKGSTDL
ncbi:MAG TPA: GAF domain-containing protein [Lentimicrobium sp.]|nr:GAF domain-containing protein [Lentimicrobium sp.]